jgi:tetratricopeptide (TPR) repeat protein
VSGLEANEIAPGDWSIEVPPGEGAVVVLAECDDPGWRARDAKGHSLEVVRADGLLVGFAAPKAGGTIRVRHEPPEVQRGAILSGFSLALAIGAPLILARRRGIGREASRDASLPPFSEHAVPRSAVPAVLALGAVVVGVGLVAGGMVGKHGAIVKGDGDTIRSAAVRTWCAEAEGAYRARAWDAAVELLERAARVVPEDASIHHRRGLVERERGRPDEARRAFEQAIVLDPSFEPSRTALRATQGSREHP